MNKARRKEIEKIYDELCGLQERMRELSDEEQEAYDNLPEGIQESERGEAMSECAWELDYITTDLEDLASRLLEVTEQY